MSILPQLDFNIDNVIQTTSKNSLPIPKEYAWDFDKNDFLLENGKYKIVEGLEALKIWIYKAFQTQRYRYLAYSWNYGHELENLVGQSLSNSTAKSEAQRYIDETLSINPYITGTTNLTVNLNNDKPDISFTVITLYGEVNVVV